MREVPGEFAWRRKIFSVIKPAFLLLDVEETPIPIRGMAIVAVGQGRHVRQAVVASEDNRSATPIGAECEGAVLVVQRVVVASREKRTHPQPRRSTTGD